MRPGVPLRFYCHGGRALTAIARRIRHANDNTPVSRRCARSEESRRDAPFLGGTGLTRAGQFLCRHAAFRMDMSKVQGIKIIRHG